MNIKSPEDDVLIRAAQAGDQEAFGELYRRYFTLVYRYSVSRVHDRLTAEDITEKAFLKVFRSLDRYQDTGYPFDKYLYRVVKNTVIDYYRRGAQHTVALKDVQGGPLNYRSMDQEVIRDERLQMIWEALEKLPPHYQEVIRLRILLEQPTAQVARWMERSPGAVRILLHRALNALRKQVGESGELDG